MKEITLSDVDSELSNIHFSKRNNINIRIRPVDDKELIFLKFKTIFDSNFVSGFERYAPYSRSGTPLPALPVHRSLMDNRDGRYSSIGGRSPYVRDIIVSELISCKFVSSDFRTYFTITDLYKITDTAKYQSIRDRMGGRISYSDYEIMANSLNHTELTKLGSSNIEIGKYSVISGQDVVIRISEYLKYIRKGMLKSKARSADASVKKVGASFEMMKLLAILNEELGDHVKFNLSSDSTSLTLFLICNRSVTVRCRTQDSLYDIHMFGIYLKRKATKEEAAALIIGFMKSGSTK